jgi:hypothetical protein
MHSKERGDIASYMIDRITDPTDFPKRVGMSGRWRRRPAARTALGRRGRSRGRAACYSTMILFTQEAERERRLGFRAQMNLSAPFRKPKTKDYFCLNQNEEFTKVFMTLTLF